MAAVLRKILAHRIIEAAAGLQRAAAEREHLVVGGLGRTVDDATHRGPQQRHARGMSVVHRSGRRRRMPPRGHSNTETATPTSATDHDVLDADEPDRPARRLDEVEDDQHHHGEGRLPGDERCHLGHEGRAEGDHRQQQPHDHRVDADQLDHGDTQPETQCGTGDRAQHPGSGGERTAAQHRQGAEDNPEPVLHREDVGDRDGQRQAQPARRLLRSTSARVARKPLVMAATAVVSGITQSAVLVSGSLRPSTRAHTGRASASAALRMMRPVTPTVAEKVRRPNKIRPTSTAAASSGTARICSMSSR